MVNGREGDPRIVAPTASNFSCDVRAPSRESRAFRTGRTVFNLPIIDLVRRGESVVICRLNVRAPPVLDSRCVPSRNERGLAHMRAHASFLLESCFGFVGEKHDGRAPEPTIFIAHDDRRSWTFECVAVVVRMSKHLAVPPHDLVRSPGQMEFGEGPISARSPTEPLPKSVVSLRRKAASPEPVGSGWARELYRLSTVAMQVQAVVFAVRIVRSPRCSRPKPPSRHAGVRTGVRKDRYRK